MFCNKCGNQTEATATFCNKCGNQINATIPTQAAVKPSNKKPIVIVAAIIAIVVVIAVIIGTSISNANKTESEYDRTAIIVQTFHAYKTAFAAYDMATLAELRIPGQQADVERVSGRIADLFPRIATQVTDYMQRIVTGEYEIIDVKLTSIHDETAHITTFESLIFTDPWLGIRVLTVEGHYIYEMQNLDGIWLVGEMTTVSENTNWGR
jgi:O-phosphoseryl-tRNA(Cys) synthetase